MDITEIWKEFDAAKREGDYEKAFTTVKKLQHDYPYLSEHFKLQELNLCIEIDDPQIVNKIDLALRNYPNSSEIYELKSDIFYRTAFDQENLDAAINLVNQAISFLKTAEMNFEVRKFEALTGTDTQPDQSWIVTTQDTQNKFLDKKMSMNITLQNLTLRRDAANAINSLEQKIEKFEGEKIKQFEQLALFSAILALIITNVQVATKLDLDKIFVLNISLAITLIFVLASGNLLLGVGQSETFYKRWNFWFAVSVILLGGVIYLLVK